MEILIKRKIKPFIVPNFVVVYSEGESRPPKHPSIPLSDLSVEDLYLLCEMFTAEVFKKAGKDMPPQQG